MIRARSIIKSTTILTRRSCFHTTSIINAATVFKMPAMSPTMTEGGIISWKYKPGESFNSGDVLLEVETDKATIDVEAVDDGKMFEILVGEGAKGVPVGKAIAFIAEPEDDLSSLTRPEVEEEAAPKAAAAEEKKPAPAKPAETPKQPESKPTVVESKSGIFQKANPKQKLSPAVELLLHENNISSTDAINQIPASGPNGRLLKGDVLAHLGSINRDSIIKLTEFLNSKQHLDLSNIVIAKPEPPKPEEVKKDATTPVEKPKPKNILSIDLVCDLGTEEDISPAKFKFAFENSIKSAIKQSYGIKFPQYISSPTANVLREQDDLFDEIINPGVTKKRFEVYDISYKFYQSSPASTKSISIASDPFDELLGLESSPVKKTIKSKEGESSRQKVNVGFKVKYDEKLIDSKQFVEYFEDSLLSQIPTNSITITN
ncbi:PDX1 [[Candida] subhashii]|uniref:Dihydrolipoamide dehydrogenase-binding protein of pyruvate dehydrogenase complex n=1 Tax=[Candida] subhashii TaxID=561895 RepID=A0A8J5UXS4_9ASCO|nr:PDX1 [[Candida] subhashii]KAG7662539.1 PDX1 [[Candida] subhashii]